MRLILETFTVPPFAENTYLLGDADAGEAIVVDPGGRAAEIVRVAERHGLRIDRIVNTHSHIDHVSGVDDLRGLTGARFFLHPDAEPMMAQLSAQAAMFGLPPLSAPRVDAHLSPGDELRVGGIRLAVRHTPGHAPGHVTLVSQPISRAEGSEWAGDDEAKRLALCGDVVFLGSIGRVDLPGGDYETLMRSIEREILSLPDSTVLFPGHGPATQVGRERASNPFILQWLAGRTGS